MAIKGLTSFTQNLPKNTKKEKKKVDIDSMPAKMKKSPKRAKIPKEPSYKEKKKDKPYM
ncbi:MAG TPA: hypothetical protein VNU45_19140 [Rummeliibacillus sp.]|nr:hypothetical protein [Rummeliibacillus sp.]